MRSPITLGLGLSILLASCAPTLAEGWVRDEANPVYRDPIENVDYEYEVASDAHVFFTAEAELAMIYTGDVDGEVGIKLVEGTSPTAWANAQTLLTEVAPSGVDRHKETAFYRRTSAGKHQIYYIGYADEETYQAQIFLAEADALEGPYTQMDRPIAPRGDMAGENVYLMTSPSVVEHEGLLYLSFIGWDASPNDVTEIWVMGATSADEGQTWTDFQKVDTPIGMEGQVTKVGEGEFVSVRTGEYGNAEAIYYGRAAHPFGPWHEDEEPILLQQGELEKDEIIAPQITIDPSSGEELLFYTGADHQRGWWIMLAQRPETQAL